MWQVPHFEPGERLSASKLNTVADFLGPILTSRFANGSMSSCGILTADVQSESIWVQVTANNGATPPAHTWVEAIDDGTTQYVQKPDGLSGNPTTLPLYDINGATIPNLEFVRAWQGSGEYYLCDFGGTPNTQLLACVTSLTTSTVHLGSLSNVMQCYPASVHPYALNGGLTSSGSEPRSSDTPNAWLFFNTGLSGTPFYWKMYFVTGIGTNIDDNLPVYIVDGIAPFSQLTTPVSFLDNPSSPAAQLGLTTAALAGAGVTGMQPMVFTSGGIIFGGLPGSVGGLPITFPAGPSLYIGAGNPSPGGSYTVYKGDTGTSGTGDQFISGLCVTIGGQANLPVIPKVLDGGSDW